MKWFSELWAGASDAVKIALLAGLVILAGLLLWLVGGSGLETFGAWLGAN